MIDLTIERRTQLGAKVIPFVTLLLGVVALACWVIPNFCPIGAYFYKGNTALGMICASLATIILQNPKRFGKRGSKVVIGLSIFVLILGALTTAEYFFAIDLGIDRVFVTGKTDPMTLPGRMSPICAMAFTLLGIGLLLFNKTWDRDKMASAAALALIPVAVISLFASVGHLYNLKMFYQIGTYSRITWMAALSFLGLSTALIFSQTRLSPVRVMMSCGVGGMTARRLLPLVVALPITLTWFGLFSERLGFVREEFAVSLLGMVMVVMLITVFLLVARNMDRLYFRELEFKERERSASERLVQVLEATQLATFEWNVDTKKLTWNTYHEQLFGYEPGSPAREPEDFSRRVHPDDLPKVLAAAEMAIKTGTEFDSDYRIILPTGKVRWLYCKGRHFYEQETGSTMLRGTVIDLTELKLAEQKARESENRLNLALTSAKIGFWDFNFTTGELDLSQTFLEDWGMDAAAYKGTWADCQRYIHSDDRMRVVQAAGDSIARKEPFSAEYRVVRGNGEIIWISSKGRYIEDERPENRRLTGITINITERKRAVLELEQAKEQAESASRLKSAFLANMSHEIRTPLGVMLGFTDLITDPKVNEKDKLHFADTLKRNGEQLTLLINDILDLSKVEAGQLKIDSVPFSLRALITETIAALKVKADEKGLRLTYTIDNEFADLMLSDPIRIKQILWNLIGNAIKFTPQGEISLNVLHKRERLEILISDSGIGISEEQQAALFKPFSQADESITRKFGGTGLGLALSRRLAELLGGDLTLEHSVLGHGSIFKLVVRDFAFTSKKTDPELHVLPTTFAGISLDKEECLRGIRILLVEDSPDNQDLIARILNRKGARVEIADNGKIGAEMALRGVFDVVLMDVQMPVLDGLSATTLLRTVGYNTPIVALTAHAMSEVRSQCIAAGCSDYLSKPVNARELVRKVLLLSQRARRPEIVS